MISKMRDTKTDCQRLTPGALLAENEYVQQLQVRCIAWQCHGVTQCPTCPCNTRHVIVITLQPSNKQPSAAAAIMNPQSENQMNWLDLHTACTECQRQCDHPLLLLSPTLSPTLHVPLTLCPPQDEMKRIDEDLTEAEAKNRLYYLLGERTRWA